MSSRPRRTPEPIDVVVGREVAAARTRLDLSQAELGELLGWKKSTISDIEAGVRSLRLRELRSVLGALQVSWDDVAARINPQDLGRRA